MATIGTDCLYCIYTVISLTSGFLAFLRHLPDVNMQVAPTFACFAQGVFESQYPITDVTTS